VFCHVSDEVSGLTSLLHTERSIGDVFNIGGVGEISINALAEKVISITGSKSKIVLIPYDQAYPVGFEDMQRRVPNTKKIESLTGWKPQLSIDEIILSIYKSLS
jgi:UDP-glucose 4-epimerase